MLEFCAKNAEFDFSCQKSSILTPVFGPRCDKTRSHCFFTATKLRVLLSIWFNLCAKKSHQFFFPIYNGRRQRVDRRRVPRRRILADCIIADEWSNLLKIIPIFLTGRALHNPTHAHDDQKQRQQPECHQSRPVLLRNLNVDLCPIGRRQVGVECRNIGRQGKSFGRSV